MKNTMEIDGYKAVIEYDPEIEMFRGEFVGLNGGADFYAADIEGLKREGATSLRVFLEMCAEDGVELSRETMSRLDSGEQPVRVSLDELIAEAERDIATGEAAKKR